MKQIKKVYGEYPITTVVLTKEVEFNAEGIAEIEDEEVIEVLLQIPGYEEVVYTDPSEDDDKEEEAPEVPEAPKKALPKKAPAKPKAN
jgi:hypothetical protein